MKTAHNLAAQNAVLRQALERVAMEEKQEPISLGGDKYYRCRVCGGEGGHKGLCPLAETPSEAAERVQGLVDALRFCYDATTKDKGLTMHEATRIYATVRDALAKFEGGGK